jgi:large subunit ribosomal protein L3
MLTTVFATKVGMTQAWTTSGKRLAVTRCVVKPMAVIGHQTPKAKKGIPQETILEIGYGDKKLKNMSKPLRTRLERSGFSFGVKEIRGLKMQPNEGEDMPAVGTTLKVDGVLAVGDVVKVQGVSKGKGFAGAMKRHGFAGGPATHGQSDRARAVGSIGQRTTPGRVWKGKRMPGHMGVETKTVSGLVVLHIDPITQEIWLNGPVPGFDTSTLVIRKTGDTRSVELDMNASGIEVKVIEETQVEEVAVEAAEPVEAVIETLSEEVK